MRLIQALTLAALFTGSLVQAANISFPECPAAGNDTTGCELLITVTAVSGGSATAFTVSTSSPDLGPYDGADDTLVGILNNSGSTLTSIALSSSTDIFGFDGDGVCTYIACPGGSDPSTYGPASVSYTGINSTDTSGTVNFSPGIASGGSAFFSLEEALTATQIVSAAPEPSTLLMLGFGLAGIASFRAQAARKRRSRTPAHSGVSGGISTAIQS